MKPIEQVKTNFSSAIGWLILVLLSIRLLDQRLAGWIAEYLTVYAPFVKTSNIPDLLLMSCIILSSLSWIAYFYLVSQNIRDRNTLFCRVMGTALPLAFGMKIISKWLFGRTEARTWLLDPSSYGFHWLGGQDGFQGFPSGHMLVFTPLFLALWHFYPCYRLYYGLAWLTLGVALVITEYHFLSDVIAGAYIGFIVYRIVICAVGQNQIRSNSHVR